MEAHLIDTHLLVPRSRSSAKVKVKYQGHVSQKMVVSGALVFHKHILFLSDTEFIDKFKKLQKCEIAIISDMNDVFSAPGQASKKDRRKEKEAKDRSATPTAEPTRGTKRSAAGMDRIHTLAKGG